MCKRVCFYVILAVFSCLVILSYFDSFGFYSDAYLFSNQRQKRNGSRWKGRWGETGMSKGRETVVRIYCI